MFFFFFLMSSKKTTTPPAYRAFHVKGDYFTEIGAAWRSKSGEALNVQLDLLPPDGRFVLSEPKAKPPKAATSEQ